jgi:hypothetical protein
LVAVAYEGWEEAEGENRAHHASGSRSTRRWRRVRRRSASNAAGARGSTRSAARSTRTPSPSSHSGRGLVSSASTARKDSASEAAGSARARKGRGVPSPRRRRAVPRSLGLSSRQPSRPRPRRRACSTRRREHRPRYGRRREDLLELKDERIFAQRRPVRVHAFCPFWVCVSWGLLRTYVRLFAAWCPDDASWTLAASLWAISPVSSAGSWIGSFGSLY